MVSLDALCTSRFAKKGFKPTLGSSRLTCSVGGGGCCSVGLVDVKFRSLVAMLPVT